MIVTARYRGEHRFANDVKITVPDRGVPLLGADRETVGRLLGAEPDGDGGLLLTLDVQDGIVGPCTVDGFGLVYNPAKPG